MKKLFVIAIMFMSVFILTGCFEDRIYIDLKTVEEIESAGPFEKVYIYYSKYRKEWNIEIAAHTPCGEVKLEVDNSSLQAGFNEIKTQFKCLEEKCK